MTQRQSEDRVQIHYTMALYCNSVDSGDVEGVLAAFAEDAQLELSSGTKVRGKAAIRAFYLPVIGPDRPDRVPGEPIPLLRHNLTTSRVEFTDENTAQGWTYFMTLTRHGLDHAGRYVDRLVRQGDRWLLQDRRILVEWYASPSWYEQVRLKAGAAKR
jgi:SnoaL-like domain